MILTNGSSCACVRFVKRIKIRSVSGSIQSEVPVNPRCPKLSFVSASEAVDSGVSVELVRVSRYHEGRGHWGDEVIPAIHGTGPAAH